MAQPRTPRSPDTLERTRYFSRQTVLPADLEQDPEYLIHKARRHNRVLHGWGIWSGLEVDGVPMDDGTDGGKKTYQTFMTKVGRIPMTVDPKSGTWLAIAPGFALTPLGDEVYLHPWAFVDWSREIDGGLVTAPASCRALAKTTIPRTGTMILVVDAQEDETQPVRAASARCGGHPDQFEFSRLVDTLRFRLLKQADVTPFADPYGTTKKSDSTDPTELARREEARLVTGCVQREYIRLAALTFDKDGKIASLDVNYTENVATQNRDWFTQTTPVYPPKPGG